MIAGLLLFIIYNLSEVRLQSCAAHKAAVDIRLCKQFCSGSCINRSAVLDTDCFCSRFVIDFTDAYTDGSTNFLKD